MEAFLAVLSILIFVVTTITLRAQPNHDGQIVQPSHDVSVPAEVREKLSEAADIRAFLALSNHDCVVVYDTVRDKPNTANFMDNNPRIALFRGDAVLLDIDSGAAGGPIRFHGMATIPVSHEVSVLAFAFQLGVDGAGTFFVFVGQKPQGYSVVAALKGSQAQLRFNESSPGKLELWTADGQVSHDPYRQCVWCPKYYKRTAYAWKNGQLRPLKTIRTQQGYQPDTFDELPFVMVK
jgi:hypothetical protein